MKSISLHTYKAAIIGYFLALLVSGVANAQLAVDEIQALEKMALRKGLERLDYNETARSWSIVKVNIFYRIFPSFGKKNRFNMIKPLEDLVQDVSIGYRESVQANKECYHLIRRAYTSLSSLYSYYKIHPSTNLTKQSEFMNRFSTVLIRLKAIVCDIEKSIPLETRYKELPKTLSEINKELESIGNHETKVDRVLHFDPVSHVPLSLRPFVNEPQKKIALFLIHGTFAAGSHEYSSDEAMLLQQAKLFAQTLANHRGVKVELYSFGWKGYNDNETRMVAGEELANFVRTFFPSEDYHDVYLGHSHGGNVLLHFAHTLREYHTPFLIITFATPIRKDFITDNLNYLVHFYADSDLVQHIGSHEITARNSTGTGQHAQSARSLSRSDIVSLGLFKNNDRFEKVNIYDVRVLFNYSSPQGMFKSHSDLKYLIGLLPRVLDTLFQYRPNQHLVFNTQPVGPKIKPPKSLLNFLSNSCPRVSSPLAFDFLTGLFRHGCRASAVIGRLEFLEVY